MCFLACGNAISEIPRVSLDSWAAESEAWQNRWDFGNCPGWSLLSITVFSCVSLSFLSFKLRASGNVSPDNSKMRHFLGVGWQDVTRAPEDWLNHAILLSSRQVHTTDLSFCPACRRLTSSCGFHR